MTPDDHDDTAPTPGTTVQVPDGFLWGAATSAQQVEGQNHNASWWELEHRDGTRIKEPAGDACDSYHRYDEDIAILAGAGLDTYRFSVEWARIEPEEGEWSRAALDHYRRMIEACHRHHVTPMVTYHHFTVPRWVARAGGWAQPSTVDRFARYCERVTKAIGADIAWACTVNEPSVVVMGVRDAAVAARWRESLVRAHRAAVDAIKSIAPQIRVGLPLALPDLQAVEGGEEACRQQARETQDHYLEQLDGDDFVGVQTYTRELYGPEGVVAPAGVETTLTGWEVYPQALEASIRKAARVSGLPVVVTENGIATADDDQRIAYTRSALAGVGRCLADGVDVRGYLHWSLLDNYEWMYGYAPTFGLVAVDRETFERRPKPSIRFLGGVATSGALPV